MANFICTYSEDGCKDEFRIISATLSDAEEKAYEQLAEDLGLEAPGEQLDWIRIEPATK